MASDPRIVCAISGAWDQDFLRPWDCGGGEVADAGAEPEVPGPV